MAFLVFCRITEREKVQVTATTAFTERGGSSLVPKIAHRCNVLLRVPVSHPEALAIEFFNFQGSSRAAWEAGKDESTLPEKRRECFSWWTFQMLHSMG
jgi:hypothetical protein